VTDAEQPTETAARIGYIGKRLGRFVVTAELGRGGMATVYRARDPELGRDVAIKVMHGFFAGRADLEARFRREANAVATIRHPSILNVFDFAPPAGEEPGYIVSELIAGPGLRAVLDDRGGKLPPEVAVLLAARVADALGAAHAAGIVHRDVKPDNVLIDRANGGARVVLTDFGVAHISGMDTMTATGAVLGSPSYMSPEQARSEDVGAASDVFSLGVMLYQLSTGHLPFAGKDPLAIITGILRGRYRRPGEIEPRVGPELERVIARCLEPLPAARFPDAAAVASALREVLADVRQGAALGDESAALRRFLDEPVEFERTLYPMVARAAVAAGERARKLGQTTRALAEAGRALAYAPDHPEATALLERIGRAGRLRSWRTRGFVVVGTLAVAAGLGAGWRTWKASRPAAPVAAAPAPSPAGPPSAAGSSLPPTLPAAPMAASKTNAPDGVAVTQPPRATETSAERRRRRGARATGVSATVAPPPSAEAPSAHAPSTQKVADPPAAPEPAATAVDKVEPPPGAASSVAGSSVTSVAAKASLVLRASYGFCEPSLDTQKPSLRATYRDLAPGRHEIFCTLPQGGAKVLVTSYDLRPGAKVSLVIVPGPDGRPIIGRAE
jgi:tRNA A-37 threonylcarbamoyl transferase component Bud32